MGYKTIMDTTTNRSVYNRSRKRYLDNVGEIRCSFCPYHRVENSTNKPYGGYKRLSFGKRSKGKGLWRDKTEFEQITYPNWKLVSKNRKQWMKKQLKVKNYRNGSWEFIF